MELKKGSKNAVVCRGGPSNGPFSAQAFATFREGLLLNGFDVCGIYAVSGSCPTALLGCINEENKLCDIWFNLTPEDIVGDLRTPPDTSPHAGLSSRLKNRVSRWHRNEMVALNIYKYGYAFSNQPLINLLKKHCLPNLDRIFGPEATLMKIGAVDDLTAQNIIFSNRVPEHKELICVGAVGSMCLVPWFPSPTIDNPVKRKLVNNAHPDFDSVFLIDGAYRASILLEEAIRESIGYDVIFVIDINGLEYEYLDPEMPYNVATRIQRAMSILITTNDQLLLSLAERINEGVEIKRLLEDLEKKIPSEYAYMIKLILEKMNNGRLRLADKHDPEIIKISNPDYAILFDFTKFNQADVAHLMRAGHNAALKTLRELGLSTKGIPLIKP